MPRDAGRVQAVILASRRVISRDGCVLRIAGKRRNAQWLCKRFVPRAGFTPFPRSFLLSGGFIPGEVAERGCHPCAGSHRQGGCLAELYTSASLVLPAKTGALAKNLIKTRAGLKNLQSRSGCWRRGSVPHGEGDVDGEGDGYRDRDGDGNGNRDRDGDGDRNGDGEGEKEGDGEREKERLPACSAQAARSPACSLAHPAQLISRLAAPRLPRLGGEDFSSTEGLQLRHKKADGNKQVIFIPMN